MYRREAKDALPNEAEAARFLGKKKSLTGQTTGKSIAVFVDKTGVGEK
jgi:hypothetical protein